MNTTHSRRRNRAHRAAGIAAALVSLALLSTPAIAQGGAVTNPEIGSPASGSSSAGHSALARDPSTVYHNPAGMTRLDGDSYLVSGFVSYLTARFRTGPNHTTPGDDGNNAGSWIEGAGLFVKTDLPGDADFGLSVTAPFGSTLHYDHGWAGRYHVRDSEFLVTDIQPAFAVKANERLSVGIGLNVQYTTVVYSFAVDQPGPAPDNDVKIDVDGWGVGFSLGLLYEHTEHTRTGVKYRSKVEHDLNGDVTINPGGIVGRASLDFDLPAALNVSVYHDVDEHWSLIADVGWTDWSKYQTFNFVDSYRIAAGLHYKPNDDWLLQTGVSVDTAAARIANSNAIMPADEIWRYSAGAEYAYGKSTRIGMTYTYVDYGASAIDINPDSSGGRVQGDFSRADLHSLNLYLTHTLGK